MRRRRRKLCWFCGKRRGGGGGREGLLPAWETAVSQSINQDEENFFKGKRGEREKQKSVGRWKKSCTYSFTVQSGNGWVVGWTWERDGYLQFYVCGHEGTGKVRASQISHKNKKALNVFALPSHPFTALFLYLLSFLWRKSWLVVHFAGHWKLFWKEGRKAPLTNNSFTGGGGRGEGKAKRNWQPSALFSGLFFLDVRST